MKVVPLKPSLNWQQSLFLSSHAVLLLGLIIQYADVLQGKKEHQSYSEFTDIKILDLDVDCDWQ